MNKDSNDFLDSNLKKILDKDLINSIFCADPFLKAGILAKLVEDVNMQVLYLDLDLMYSGYLTAQILPMSKNVKLYQPTFETFNQIIKEIIMQASQSQSIIIIDSLNGLFNILNREKKIGRLAMSIIMLLASISRMTDSYVLISNIVRYSKEGWILSSTGKRIIETRKSRKITLEYAADGIQVLIPNQSIKMIIPSSLIPLS